LIANGNDTRKLMRYPKNRLCSVLLVLLFLQACTTQVVNAPIPPSLLREPRPMPEAEASSGLGPEQQEEGAGGNVRRGPSFPENTRFTSTDAMDLPDNLPSGKFSAGYNNIPVEAFINEVFGDQLRLSFSIDPLVQELKDLVSLRLIDKVDSARLFNIARETLASYGVSITEQQELYVFSYSESATASSVPLVVTGLALPDVPVSHRPLFVNIPIKIVSSERVYSFLQSAFQGQDIRILPLTFDNSILLQGRRPLIDQALAIIDVLDNLHSSGKFTVIIEPVTDNPSDLVGDMVNVLRAEGYEASKSREGSIQILSLSSSNKIIILAADEEALEHSVGWFHELDRKRQSDIKDGIFSYQVRNTDASHIVELLGKFSDAGVDGSGSSSGNDYVADENLNAILYKGSGQRWLEILPTIKKLDRPSPSVLVEVILAEITLGDTLQTGVEFIARAGNVAYTTLSGASSGGGLVATLTRAGETRAVVNAFYSDARSNIRSRPRLMVKSGETASIDVGNEIPTIIGSTQSLDNPGAPIVQTVSYRKTGVLLKIKPVVYSSGYVEIELSQELSEAQTTKSSAIDSPTIFNRTLNTTVTLRDGGSVLLGGLISETQSKGNSGVPGLGAIPLLGRIFRANVSSTDRTELVMMVVPYIIENPEEANQISDLALKVYQMSQ
jgi:general secretion pathway protein D